MNNPAVYIFCGIGLLLLLALGSDLLRKRRAARWPKTIGVVTKSVVEKRQKRKNRTTFFHPVVEYTFKVAGESVSGTDIYGRATGNTVPSFAEDTVSRYPVNGSVDVYYNPMNPSDCLLEPELKTSDYLIMLIPFASIGVGIYIAMKGG